MTLKKLSKHLFSLPNKNNAIPYITSYYKDNWGFCISHKEREKLKDGIYEVFIDSRLFSGSMTYGELILKGKSKKEIFLSTYICHPSMANNELSGPVLLNAIMKYIKLNYPKPNY